MQNWQRNRSESRNKDDPDRQRNGPGERFASKEPVRNLGDSSRNQTRTKFLTCKDAGVPQGCCIRFASNQHKISDPSCIRRHPTPQLRLQKCWKGGTHYSRYCKFPKDSHNLSSSRWRNNFGAPPKFSQRGARSSRGRPSITRNQTSARKTHENQLSAEKEITETFFLEDQD